jgi:hypothetical protein
MTDYALTTEEIKLWVELNLRDHSDISNGGELFDRWLEKVKNDALDGEWITTPEELYKHVMAGVKAERERIIRVANVWVDEMRGHDGECSCTHAANVLSQFIQHDEFGAVTP